MSETNHTCPKPDHGMLPVIIYDAATRGRATQVMSWLEKGGDINASDMSARTLVFLACEYNHLELLTKLLKHPEVHLNQEANQSYSGKVPLSVAIYRGNLECAEAIINSPSLCQISKTQKPIGDKNSIIKLEPNRIRWPAVDLLLKNGFIIDADQAISLLYPAVRNDEINIVKDILKQDFLVSARDNFPFQEIYELNKWEETGIEALFKKSVAKENDTCKKILSTMLEKDDWKGLESLLKIINGDVEIHIDLAQAVREKNSEHVANLLSEEKLGNEVLNGTLLIASIGGTTDDIVNMLLDKKYKYSSNVLNESLILACLNNQIVLLPSLFQRDTFNCTILDRAKEASSRSTIQKLVDRAMKRVARTLIPLEKDNGKETKDN